MCDVRQLDRFRTMARCLHPALQRGLWLGERRGRGWALACRQLFMGFTAGKEPLGCVYAVLDFKSGIWYLGKCIAQRRQGASSWPGAVVRFKEHLSQTLLQAYRTRSQEPRYNVWRRSARYRLCFVPCLRAQDEVLLDLEQRFIRLAEPPTQRNMRASHRLRRAGRRPYPRFRDTLARAERECQNNCWQRMVFMRTSFAADAL
jgi:hypothetical protein